MGCAGVSLRVRCEELLRAGAEMLPAEQLPDPRARRLGKDRLPGRLPKPIVDVRQAGGAVAQASVDDAKQSARLCALNILAQAEEKGVELSDPQAREIVYGMPYDEWRKQHQKEATPKQQAAFAASKPKHARIG